LYRLVIWGKIGYVPSLLQIRGSVLRAAETGETAEAVSDASPWRLMAGGVEFAVRLHGPYPPRPAGR